MPLWNLLSVVAFIVAAALIYKFRLRILAPLRRFEANNAARRAEEARALFDRYAHYRQTVQLAEEQVEEVTKLRVADPRTGEPVERYLFLGVQYGTRREAELARHEAVVEKAREFYIELDRIYLGRRGWRGYRNTSPALEDRSTKEDSTPPRP
jgi:hypothetical protein